MRAQADAQQAEIERGVQSDPLVQAVLNRFPGAKIVGVTQSSDVGESAPDVLPDSEDE
jgi:trans-aconitate methyltransferase